MTLITLAVVLLVASVCLFAVTAVCEREAMLQMASTNFHHVQLIRLGRTMRIPAMLCVFAYMLACMTAAPVTGTTTVLVAFIITMLTQSRAMMFGQATQAFLRGLAPSLLCLMTFTNLDMLPLPGALHGLGLPAATVGLAVAASVLSWLTAVFRVEQDLIAIRD